MELRNNLCTAILKNDRFWIELILKNPEFQNCCKTCSTYSPLYISILTGNKDLTHRLIEEYEVDINEVTYMTPLQLTILMYDLDTALFLISKDANVLAGKGISTLNLIKNRKSNNCRLKMLILYRYIYDFYYNKVPSNFPEKIPDELCTKLVDYL